MNQITLLVLLTVASLFLPASVIMYASGSPQNSDESDSGSADDGSTDDASDDGSMDDASDDGSMDDESDDGSMEMDDESDTWSMEKSNNALMENDDESDTWSMEKSNNALNPEPTGGTDDGLSPLTSGPTGGTNDGFAPSTPPPSTPRPTGTNDALTPLTPGPTGTPTAVDGTPTQTPTEGPSTPPTLTPGANAQQTFRIEDTTGNATGNVRGNGIADTILPIMNQERALVGAPLLTYNNSLAAKAQSWADHLATTGVLAHSTCCGAFRDYGETAAWTPGAQGNATAMAIAAANAWLAEKQNYQGGPFDLAGQISGKPLYGHYTQIVWKGTTQIGCGYAGPYTVCQFTPPGNIDGQLPY